MPADLDIMRLHAEALFTHDEGGRLKCVNENSGDEAPRLFLGRTSEGMLLRFRFDLPDVIAEELATLAREERVDNLRDEPEYRNEYLKLLERHSPAGSIATGPSYIFPDNEAQPSESVLVITNENADVLRNGFEDWIPDVLRGAPLTTVIDGGRPVSVCYSARVTSDAHEAGVETLASDRGRGFAALACIGWASEVRKLGCIPLYSTSWENTASQRVANKLGLRQYGVVFHVR